MKTSLVAACAFCTAFTYASIASGQIVGFEAESMNTLPTLMPFDIVSDAGASGGSYIITRHTGSSDGQPESEDPRAQFTTTLGGSNFDLWGRYLLETDGGGNDSLFASEGLSTISPGSSSNTDWATINGLNTEAPNNSTYLWVNFTDRTVGGGDENEQAPSYTSSGDLFIAGREAGTRLDAFAFVEDSQSGSVTPADLDAAVAASAITRETIAGTGFEPGEADPLGLSFAENVIEGGSDANSGIMSNAQHTGSNSYEFAGTGGTDLNDGAVQLTFDEVDLSGFEDVQFSMRWTADGGFEDDHTDRLVVDLELTDDANNVSTLNVFDAEAGEADLLLNAADDDFFSDFAPLQADIPDNIVSAQLIVTGATSDAAGEQVFIDDILFAGVQRQAIPEPASIAIWSVIGLGLFGFGYYRCRRKK